MKRGYYDSMANCGCFVNKLGTFFCSEHMKPPMYKDLMKCISEGGVKVQLRIRKKGSKKK